MVDTPEKAREWVQWCAANGVDGMKLVAYPPHIMSALLDEAKKHGLGSTALQTWTKAFLNRVYERTGIKAAIYVSPSFWMLGSSPICQARLDLGAADGTCLEAMRFSLPVRAPRA